MFDHASVAVTRWTRITTATLTITKAPTISLGSERSVVPFEVDLAWKSGAMQATCTVRAWRIRDDRPPKLVVKTINVDALPPWLKILVATEPEPGVSPPASPPPTDAAPGGLAEG